MTRGAQRPPSPTTSTGASDSSSRGLRALPSVEEARVAFQAHLEQREQPKASHAAQVRAIRSILASARRRIIAGEPAPDRQALLDEIARQLARQEQPNLRPVINATGVIINTNLGRAPLSQRAIDQIVAVARGYSNLEFDLASGERGSRHAHVRAALRELTGAEDALVVNNNAAATLVALAALAAGREVIISRGELVEIGGGFRVPDVMAQSDARLVEVGTTNRVRLADYASAMTSETALILVVHPSNFRIVGFTESPALVDLANLAHERGLPLMHDLGSGAIPLTERFGLGHEPTVAESLRAGADLVCFSGDKLLGGPQAGLMVGGRETLLRIERHPLMRAVRIDKLTLAALGATLQSFADETAQADLPVWRAISMSLEAIERRAQALVTQLREAGAPAEVIEGESTVGGGSLPGETLPTRLCALPARASQTHVDPDPLAAALRMGQHPVVARVLRDQVLFDLRTVSPDEDELLLERISDVWKHLVGAQPVA